MSTSSRALFARSPNHPFVRRDKIFAVANSEGTLHALNYQLGAPELPFAGLVLISPPGRSVGTVARSQIAAQVTDLPNGDAVMALYDAAIAHFLAGEPMTPDPSLPAGIRALLGGLAAPANLPFARELWTSDGAPLVAQIDVPTLVVIGKKDIQVDWRADGERLQHAAAGNAHSQISLSRRRESRAETRISAAVGVERRQRVEQLQRP